MRRGHTNSHVYSFFTVIEKHPEDTVIVKLGVHRNDKAIIKGDRGATHRTDSRNESQVTVAITIGSS